MDRTLDGSVQTMNRKPKKYHDNFLNFYWTYLGNPVPYGSHILVIMELAKSFRYLSYDKFPVQKKRLFGNVDIILFPAKIELSRWRFVLNHRSGRIDLKGIGISKFQPWNIVDYENTCTKLNLPVKSSQICLCPIL
jgi:hypothetical protein